MDNLRQPYVLKMNNFNWLNSKGKFNKNCIMLHTKLTWFKRKTENIKDLIKIPPSPVYCKQTLSLIDLNKHGIIVSDRRCTKSDSCSLTNIARQHKTLPSATVGTKGVSKNHLLSFDDNKVLKLSIGYVKHLFKCTGS